MVAVALWTRTSFAIAHDSEFVVDPSLARYIDTTGYPRVHIVGGAAHALVPARSLEPALVETTCSSCFC
jgi:hypothetical protein